MKQTVVRGSYDYLLQQEANVREQLRVAGMLHTAEERAEELSIFLADNAIEVKEAQIAWRKLLSAPTWSRPNRRAALGVREGEEELSVSGSFVKIPVLLQGYTCI